MEKWIAVSVQLGMVAIFVILGILFFKGKGAFLIAGYNTAEPEEKKRYDERALCRFVGKLMLAAAVCYGGIALGTVLNDMILTWCGIVLQMPLIVGAVIYANTGNRFRKRK